MRDEDTPAATIIPKIPPSTSGAGPATTDAHAGQCDRSVFMGAHSIKESSPEALAALLYPTNKWRTVYVYRGQTFDAFARIPAYLRLVASRSVEALTMSARDLSDEYLFSFHIPVECVIDSRATVAASKAILDLAMPTNRQ